MCKWGTEELVLVTIPADLSSTRKARRKMVGIDRCIAPIVRVLNVGGIVTRSSCCGHGKEPGHIELADGRVLSVHEAVTAFNTFYNQIREKANG